MDVLPDKRIGTAIISPDGNVERVLEIPDESLNLVCTVWSPDDKQLACQGWDDKDPSRSGVYIVRSSDGSHLSRLTTAPKGLVDIPGDFSPDGTQFIFKRAGDEQMGQIQVADLADGSLRPLSSEDFEDPGRFSPDGRSVLTSDGAQLILLDLEGDVLNSIEMPGFNLFGAVWSPDGEWVAFSGGEGGPYADVFISRADGSDQLQVTETDDNEITVEWGAD